MVPLILTISKHEVLCTHHHTKWNGIMDFHFILPCCVISKGMKCICYYMNVTMDSMPC